MGTVEYERMKGELPGLLGRDEWPVGGIYLFAHTEYGCGKRDLARAFAELGAMSRTQTMYRLPS
jgi:hypothetical protein